MSSRAKRKSARRRSQCGVYDARDITITIAGVTIRGEDAYAGPMNFEIDAPGITEAIADSRIFGRGYYRVR